MLPFFIFQLILFNISIKEAIFCHPVPHPLYTICLLWIFFFYFFVAPTCFFLMINGSPARRRTFLAGHSVALLAFLLHFWASFLRGICHFSRMTHLKTNNWERVIKIGISMAIINRKFLEFYSKFRHENARFHPKNVAYYAARVRDTAVYNSQLVCLSFGHITAIH